MEIGKIEQGTTKGNRHSSIVGTSVHRSRNVDFDQGWGFLVSGRIKNVDAIREGLPRGQREEVGKRNQPGTPIRELEATLSSFHRGIRVVTTSGRSPGGWTTKVAGSEGWWVRENSVTTSTGTRDVK